MKSSEYEVETTGWNHGAFIKISLHVFFKCKKVPQEDDAGLENIKVVCAIWSYKQIENWVCILNINRLVALTQFVVLLHRISRHDRGFMNVSYFGTSKLPHFSTDDGLLWLHQRMTFSVHWGRLQLSVKLKFEVFLACPTGTRTFCIWRTCWRDYICHLAREDLRISH